MTPYIALSTPIFIGLLALLVGRIELNRLRRINKIAVRTSSASSTASATATLRTEK